MPRAWSRPILCAGFAAAVLALTCGSALAQTMRLPGPGEGLVVTPYPQPPGPPGLGEQGSPQTLRPDLNPSIGGDGGAAPAVAKTPDPIVARPAFRFRCEIAPQHAFCHAPGVPDGGGGDADCICGRDVCYDEVEPGTGRLRRICEKR